MFSQAPAAGAQPRQIAFGPRSPVRMRMASSTGRVRFEVTDTGPGIPKEFQQSVFEKFFRAPGAASGGAGIGLSMSKEIVAAHSGEMGVESEPGQGCTFWFPVPVVVS